ncbi:MAG: hypothetical protein ACLU4N_04420 [Butyricimonas faecihominis]
MILGIPYVGKLIRMFLRVSHKNVTTYKYKAYNNNWIPQIRLAEMYLITIECGPWMLLMFCIKNFAIPGYGV